MTNRVRWKASCTDGAGTSCPCRWGSGDIASRVGTTKCLEEGDQSTDFLVTFCVDQHFMNQRHELSELSIWLVYTQCAWNQTRNWSGEIPRERTAFLRLAALELSRRPNNPFWSWRRPVSPPIELISLPNRMNKSWRIWIVSGEMVLDACFEVSYKSTYASLEDGTWSWSGGMSCWIKIWDKLLLEGISIITVRNANHQQLLKGYGYQSTKYRATLHSDLTRL